MKKTSLILLLVGSIFFVACNKKGGSGSANLKNQKDSASYALGVLYGKNLKRNGADTIFDIAILQKAFGAVLKGDSVSMADQQASLLVDAYAKKQQDVKFETNKGKGEKFLADNKSKAGVKTTASGLQYSVMKEGTGSKPAATDTVSVYYKGTTIDGKEFDSNIGQPSPISFPLNGVIPGWTEGVQLMSEGSKYKFFIPYAIGYGERGSPPTIEPFSMLVFEVELVKVKKGK